MAVTTELTVQTINDLKQAVTNYQTECQALYAQLESKIQGLTAAGSSFNGDSALGYYTDADSFFNQIKPNLTTQVDSLVEGLNKLLTQIQQHLLDTPDGADPQIGTKNKSAGTEAEAPAVTK